MQTEKSQPDGKWIMPETRFTEFAALSVDPKVGISRPSPEGKRIMPEKSLSSLRHYPLTLRLGFLGLHRD